MRDGDLLVSNMMSNALVRVDVRTGVQTVVTMGENLADPAGVRLLSDNVAVVADWNLARASRIVRIDLESGQQTLLPHTVAFVDALGILPTTNGRFLVSDPSFPDGATIFEVDAAGACRVVSQGGLLATPCSMAHGQDGLLYVADWYAFGGGGGIVRVDPTTGKQSVLSRGGAFEDPIGIAFLPCGDLLVADFSEYGIDGRVVRVDPVTGEHERVYQGGMFVRPTAIAVRSGGAAVATNDLLVEGPMRMRGGSFDSVALRPGAHLEVAGALRVRGDLAVGTNARLVASGPIAVEGDVRIADGGVMSHAPHHPDGLDLEVGGTLTVEAGGRIDVTGCGLRGGTYATQWRGETVDEAGRVVLGSPGRAGSGSGGSHGGLGARDGDGSAEGPAYGSPEDPRFLGAGGGGPRGGNGGGCVRVRAARIVVDGCIAANGAPGVALVGVGGGGGAGGSVVIRAREFSGAGRVEASGGGAPCVVACSGSGGGGRIRIDSDRSSLPTDHVVAIGGPGESHGASGTVRWHVAKDAHTPARRVGLARRGSPR
jgi:hypothetical protein